jgi:sterol desaturase/sphingolipid hydroxylase (fatty acid hydroxylase superfamily)
MENEAIIRIMFFVAVFMVCCSMERGFPLRDSSVRSSRRQVHNYLFLVIGVGITRIMPPLAAVGAAFFAEKYKIGILNWIDLTVVGSFFLCLLLFDFALYLQHIAMHKISFLWRYHSVHHSDETIDVTTGFRFHPGELFFSLCYKWLIMVSIGASPLIVIACEIPLSIFSLMTHSNIKIAETPNNIFSGVFITPTLHCLHHSINPVESNKNFGTIFSFWDKIFDTYKRCSNLKVNNLTFGVDAIELGDKRFVGLLRHPFR